MLYDAENIFTRMSPYSKGKMLMGPKIETYEERNKFGFEILVGPGDRKVIIVDPVYNSEREAKDNARRIVDIAERGLEVKIKRKPQ